jgi:hypothetical protein
MPPASAHLKMETAGSSKIWYLSTKPHNIVPQKTMMWTYTALIILSIKWEFHDQLKKQNFIVEILVLVVQEY